MFQILEKFYKHFDQIFKIFWSNVVKKNTKIWESFEEHARKLQIILGTCKKSCEKIVSSLMKLLKNLQIF